jgi:hypothetical protein
VPLRDLLTLNNQDDNHLILLDPLLTKIAFIKSLNDEVYLNGIIQSLGLINDAIRGEYLQNDNSIISEEESI